MNDILKNHKDIEADVYKVAHHGSNDSLNEAFLEELGPLYSIVSCGVDNDYGHPHDEVLDYMKGNDISVYRTDENGEITIEELRFGRYYILEKEAPEGYTLNEEKMYFEILEDGEIVKCTMVDEKIIIEVPNTGVDDYHIIEIVSSLLVLGGIGVIVYVIKKKRK